MKTGRLPMVPGTRLIDWLVPVGVVLDKERATDGTPCQCLNGACFHVGVVGEVPEDARAEVCRTEEEFEDPLATRVATFRDAFNACPIAEPESRLSLLEDLLKCVCPQLRQRGLEVC